MIGGGFRGKDRSQWDGWGLEEDSKRPAADHHSPRQLYTFTRLRSRNKKILI